MKKNLLRLFAASAALTTVSAFATDYTIGNQDAGAPARAGLLVTDLGTAANLFVGNAPVAAGPVPGGNHKITFGFDGDQINVNNTYSTGFFDIDIAGFNNTSVLIANNNLAGGGGAKGSMFNLGTVSATGGRQLGFTIGDAASTLKNGLVATKSTDNIGAIAFAGTNVANVEDTFQIGVSGVSGDINITTDAIDKGAASNSVLSIDAKGGMLKTRIVNVHKMVFNADSYTIDTKSFTTTKIESSKTDGRKIIFKNSDKTAVEVIDLGDVSSLAKTVSLTFKVGESAGNRDYKFLNTARDLSKVTSIVLDGTAAPANTEIKITATNGIGVLDAKTYAVSKTLDTMSVLGPIKYTLSADQYPKNITLNAGNANNSLSVTVSKQPDVVTAFALENNAAGNHKVIISPDGANVSNIRNTASFKDVELVISGSVSVDPTRTTALISDTGANTKKIGGYDDAARQNTLSFSKANTKYQGLERLFVKNGVNGLLNLNFDGESSEVAIGKGDVKYATNHFGTVKAAKGSYITLCGPSFATLSSEGENVKFELLTTTVKDSSNNAVREITYFKGDLNANTTNKSVLSLNSTNDTATRERIFILENDPAANAKNNIDSVAINGKDPITLVLKSISPERLVKFGVVNGAANHTLVLDGHNDIKKEDIDVAVVAFKSVKFVIAPPAAGAVGAPSVVKLMEGVKLESVDFVEIDQFALPAVGSTDTGVDLTNYKIKPMTTASLPNANIEITGSSDIATIGSLAMPINKLSLLQSSAQDSKNTLSGTVYANKVDVAGNRIFNKGLYADKNLKDSVITGVGASNTTFKDTVSHSEVKFTDGSVTFTGIGNVESNVSVKSLKITDVASTGDTFGRTFTGSSFVTTEAFEIMNAKVSFNPTDKTNPLNIGGSSVKIHGKSNVDIKSNAKISNINISGESGIIASDDLNLVNPTLSGGSSISAKNVTLVNAKIVPDAQGSLNKISTNKMTLGGTTLDIASNALTVSISGSNPTDLIVRDATLPIGEFKKIENISITNTTKIGITTSKFTPKVNADTGAVTYSEDRVSDIGAQISKLVADSSSKDSNSSNAALEATLKAFDGQIKGGAKQFVDGLLEGNPTKEQIVEAVESLVPADVRNSRLGVDTNSVFQSAINNAANIFTDSAVLAQAHASGDADESDMSMKFFVLGGFEAGSGKSDKSEVKSTFGSVGTGVSFKSEDSPFEFGASVGWTSGKISHSPKEDTSGKNTATMNSTVTTLSLHANAELGGGLFIKTSASYGLTDNTEKTKRIVGTERRDVEGKFDPSILAGQASIGYKFDMDGDIYLSAHLGGRVVNVESYSYDKKDAKNINEKVKVPEITNIFAVGGSSIHFVMNTDTGSFVPYVGLDVSRNLSDNKYTIATAFDGASGESSYLIDRSADKTILYGKAGFVYKTGSYDVGLNGAVYKPTKDFTQFRVSVKFEVAS